MKDQTFIPTDKFLDDLLAKCVQSFTTNEKRTVIQIFLPPASFMNKFYTLKQCDGQIKSFFDGTMPHLDSKYLEQLASNMVFLHTGATFYLETMARTNKDGLTSYSQEDFELIVGASKRNFPLDMPSLNLVSKKGRSMKGNEYNNLYSYFLLEHKIQTLIDFE